MNNSFIQKLIGLVEANLENENFGPEDLAREAGISRSNLNRKLRSILNKNSSQFIRETRLKKAKELLQNTELTIAEISYRVGFGSPTYFSSCFHEFYGHAPSEIKNHNPENEPEEQPVQPKLKKRNRVKILVGFLFGLMVLIPLSVFLIKKGSEKDIKEKSIAVLPFIDLSPEEGTTYIINGLQEEILDKLEKIRELNVKSRTSVEKYKDTKLNISEIGKELKVNYILEGSGQKIGDNIRIRLQLIEAASDNHLWAKPYEKEVNIETIFDIQEELALSVADELGAILTREEKIQIAKIPTQNPAAHNYYLRGIEYMKLHGSSWNLEELYKAKQNFEQAIQLDTTFAEAYVHLASIYLNNLVYLESFLPPFLDSALMMANKALLFDEKNSEAYWLRGSYYERMGLLDIAEKEYAKCAALEKESKINYRYMSNFFRFFSNEDYYNAIVYYFKYQETKTEEREFDRAMLHDVCYCFSYSGYLETAKLYCRKFLDQYNDSSNYYIMMADFERDAGNFENAENFDLKWYEIDSTDAYCLSVLIYDQILKRDYESAYKYVVALENEYSKAGREIDPYIPSGSIYLIKGDTKKAEYHLKGCEQMYLKDTISRWNNKQLIQNFYLATVYSIMGDKRKTLDNLKKLKNRETDFIRWVTCLNTYPCFDFIRDEPEFIEVVKDVEAKYQKEHERVGKLLKEKGIL